MCWLLLSFLIILKNYKTDDVKHDLGIRIDAGKISANWL